MKHWLPIRFVGRVRVSGTLIRVNVVGACEEALEDDASIVPTSACTEVFVGNESVLDDATLTACASLEVGGGGGGSMCDEACLSLEEETTVAFFSRARPRSSCCRRRVRAVAPNMSKSAWSDELEACCNSCT